MSKVGTYLTIILLALLPLITQAQQITHTPSAGDVGSSAGSRSADQVSTPDALGIGYTLGQQTADAVPLQAPVSRTSRSNPTPTAKASTFLIGDWEYESYQGEFLGYSIDYADAHAELQSFDPEQFAVEVGAVYIGESNTAPTGCRQFTYTSGFTSIFLGICIHDDHGMYVVGTEFDAVDMVMNSFSRGLQPAVPFNYYRTYD